MKTVWIRASHVCKALAATAVVTCSMIQVRGDDVRLRVETGTAARRNTPVVVALPAAVAARVADDQEKPSHAAIVGRVGDREVNYPVQFERTDDGVRMWFVLQRAEANETLDLTLRSPAEVGRTASFHFVDRPGEYCEYRYGDDGVLRHMIARDDARHDETYKVYTHIYGYHGEPFITKGPDGTYPHHRGMYVGWNRTHIDGQRFDFWHMRPKGTVQKHIAFEDNQLAGPVIGRRTSRIDWNTPDGKTVIEERRTIAAVWQPPGQSLFDVDIELHSRAGEIRLEGDPQHAGFQVRAVQAVHDHQADTVYYVSDDSDYKKNVTATGPWLACSFELQEHPYTVLYFSHPTNPHRDTAVLSTRQYGRFGEYFATDLRDDRPLRLKYRVVVMDQDRHGAMSTPRAQAKYHDFASPVKVTFAD